MDRHIFKRWKREHGKRTNSTRTPNQWRFHKQTWGMLEVLVLPQTDPGTMQTSDSNTGVVVNAPDHGTLRGHLVVNNGSKPTADTQAINQIMCGDPKKDWKTAQPPGFNTVHCLPRRKMEDADRNEIYWSCVDSIREGQKLTQEHAVNLADQILGWSPDTISCKGCSLTVHGLGAKELFDQCREYNWSMNTNSSPVNNSIFSCPACSPFHNSTPIPNWAELNQIIPIPGN